MSLRSVDLQVVLSQVSEVNKNQPLQNQQSHTQQQQFAAELQKQSENQRQQVQDSKKSEEGKIDQQTKGQRRGQESEHHGSREEQENDETKISAKDPAKGNLLDIKI